MNPKDVLISELKKLIRDAIEEEEYHRLQGGGGLHNETLNRMREATREESPE